VLSWRRAGRAASARAVFVDRDGVINRWIRGGYALTRRDVVFNDDVVEALRAIDRGVFALVVASNQSCVRRGLLSESGLIALMEYVVDQLDRRGLSLDAWYCCPHAPRDGCGCRKPAPGLLTAAGRDLGLNLRRSYFIGDQPTDMAAAQRAGVRGLPVRPDDAGDVRTQVSRIAQELERAG
jgi:D-glycero-D-manno-heptose 1,7-bisphosphate phosphatase